MFQWNETLKAPKASIRIDIYLHVSFPSFSTFSSSQLYQSLVSPLYWDLDACQGGKLEVMFLEKDGDMWRMVDDSMKMKMKMEGDRESLVKLGMMEEE